MSAIESQVNSLLHRIEFKNNNYKKTHVCRSSIPSSSKGKPPTGSRDRKLGYSVATGNPGVVGGNN
jgi:hypothetical protein